VFFVSATIDQTMRQIFGIEPSVETRLWEKYSSSTYTLISKLDITDAGLYSGEVILIEQRLPDGNWPRSATK
jgi:hypothetical protein